MILITTESSVRPKANILKPSNAPSYGYEMEIIVLLKGANILQLILTLAKFIIKYIKLHHAECTFIFILWFAIRCGGGYVPYLFNGTILFLELNIVFKYRIKYCTFFCMNLKVIWAKRCQTRATFYSFFISKGAINIHRCTPKILDIQ